MIEVQGQSRFSQGLMPGSVVLFHEHRLNFRKLDTRVNTHQTGGTRTKIKEMMSNDTDLSSRGEKTDHCMSVRGLRTAEELVLIRLKR